MLTVKHRNLFSQVCTSFYFICLILAYHCKCIDPWLTKNRRVCPVCKRLVFANGERQHRRNTSSSRLRDSHSDSDLTDDDRAPLVESRSEQRNTQVFRRYTRLYQKYTRIKIYCKHWNGNYSPNWFLVPLLLQQIKEQLKGMHFSEIYKA